MKKLSLYLMFTGIVSTTAYALDPGGVKYDFAAIQRQQAAGTVENLLKFGGFEEDNINLDHWQAQNTWGSAQYLHTTDQGEHIVKFRKELPGLTRRFRSAENPHSGKYCAALISPPELQQRRDTEGKPMLSNRINQSLAFPALEQPLKFRFSLFLRGKLEAVPGLNSFRLFVTFAGEDKKETRKTINHEFSMPLQWEERSLEFIAPAGTTTLGISLALYGIGEAYIDDVKLEKTAMNSGVTARVMPQAFLDKIFAAGENQPGSLVFSCNNETGAKCTNLRLAVRIPPEFEFLDAGNMPPAGEKNGVRYFDLMGLHKTFDSDFYGMYNVSTLLLKSELPASDRTYPLEYWVEDEDYRSPVETIGLKIIPAVKGETPKMFRTAAMYGREMNYTSAPAVESVVKFYRDGGFNSIHGHFNPALAKALKDNGVVRYIQPYFLCNGYRIGNTPKPPEALFRLVDGSPWTKPNEKICPVEVYRQGDYYRKEVVAMLEKILVVDDIADQIMPNWEPYYLDFKGCFCPRCKEEFIKYAEGKISADDINARWPGEIINSYRADWIKFRSWQHGRLVVQLEKTINEIGKKAGKDSHFIPEIAWSKMLPERDSNFAQYDIADYILELPWLEPWGPYIFHRFTQTYEYFPGLHLIAWNAAGVIKKFTADHGQPGMIAFPHGYQGQDWITEPEALAFEFLCFFLNGWNGAFGYFFPRGYDHRYWQALAGANTAIARFEEIVFQGKEISPQVRITPETPLPEPFFPAYWSEGGNFTRKLPGLAKSRILQYKAFQQNDRHLVAVGNFWQKGECFFKLHLDGLNISRNYAVSMNGDSLGSFTGRQLQDGILSHAGGLRWSFILVEPVKSGSVITPAYSQEQLYTLMKQRLPAIEKAVALEKSHREKHQSELNTENPVNDFSAILPVNSGNIELKASSSCLDIRGGKYQVQIDPARGAMLVNWQSGSIPPDGSTPAGMAADAFWWPRNAACLITSGYKIIDITPEGHAVKVVLQRKISKRDNETLAGLVLTKTFLFAGDTVTVNTGIENPTPNAISFSFRYHNLPKLLTAGGRGTFGDGVEFRREFFEKLYRFAPSDPELEGAFLMNKILDTKSSRITFSSPDGKTTLTVEVPPEDLQCFVFWDSGKQDYSTFEPVFRKVTLAPNGKIAYSMKWTVK
jgi:hypothetical protein